MGQHLHHQGNGWHGGQDDGGRNRIGQRQPPVQADGGETQHQATDIEHLFPRGIDNFTALSRDNQKNCESNATE